MKILGIDTSGSWASAAVCEDDRILAETSFATKLTHSQVILPLAKQVLSYANLTLADMDAFACAAGPGSYTGLRIGISAVKAISYGLGNKPCSGVSVLEALAFSSVTSGGYVCAVMKARADLVYCAFFDCSDRKIPVRLTDDAVITIKEAAEKAAAYQPLTAVGDSSAALCEMLGTCAFSAPSYLSCNLAPSVCFCAQHHELTSPDELLPLYLQITKAEKDLKEHKLTTPDF